MLVFFGEIWPAVSGRVSVSIRLLQSGGTSTEAPIPASTEGTSTASTTASAATTQATTGSADKKGMLMDPIRVAHSGG